ncbi:DsrE family protein [Marinobacterium jannaschii]|uniref:DsrE family protein n=1 Tax=Marinobacterium jannaschii TaxID=64970 RepID=UPI000A5C38B0|nr:DsrE family protein [Marinobacterium jannaschii]
MTAQAAEYAFQKVVYHINYADPSRIAETFSNIDNHLAALGEDGVDIKVVVHGKAIEYLTQARTDEAKQSRLDNLRLQGAELLVCGNTLKGYRIEYTDLYDVEASDVVEAGLPAIVDLQQRGYIYVRP